MFAGQSRVAPGRGLLALDHVVAFNEAHGAHFLDNGLRGELLLEELCYLVVCFLGRIHPFLDLLSIA